MVILFNNNNNNVIIIIKVGMIRFIDFVKHVFNGHVENVKCE